MHGSLDRVVCLTCRALSSRADLERRLTEANPRFDGVAARVNPDGDVDLADDAVRGFQLVDCDACRSGVLKPDVVFFGENVPKARVDRVLRPGRRRRGDARPGFLADGHVEVAIRAAGRRGGGRSSSSTRGRRGAMATRPRGSTCHSVRCSASCSPAWNRARLQGTDAESEGSRVTSCSPVRAPHPKGRPALRFPGRVLTPFLVALPLEAWGGTATGSQADAPTGARLTRRLFHPFVPVGHRHTRRSLQAGRGRASGDRVGRLPVAEHGPPTYIAYDGNRSPTRGPAEHTVVVVAVRPTSVRVNDPARGVSLGRQARLRSRLRHLPAHGRRREVSEADTALMDVTPAAEHPLTS